MSTKLFLTYEGEVVFNESVPGNLFLQFCALLLQLPDLRVLMVEYQLLTLQNHVHLVFVPLLLPEVLLKLSDLLFLNR